MVKTTIFVMRYGDLNTAPLQMSSRPRLGIISMRNMQDMSLTAKITPGMRGKCRSLFHLAHLAVLRLLLIQTPLLTMERYWNS